MNDFMDTLTTVGPYLIVLIAVAISIIRDIKRNVAYYDIVKPIEMMLLGIFLLMADRL